jgi:hypothetical protein
VTDSEIQTLKGVLNRLSQLEAIATQVEEPQQAELISGVQAIMRALESLVGNFQSP